MTVFRIGLREGIVCSESNGADSTGILLVKLLRSCMLEEEMKIIINNHQPSYCFHVVSTRNTAQCATVNRQDRALVISNITYNMQHTTQHTLARDVLRIMKSKTEHDVLIAMSWTDAHLQ